MGSNAWLIELFDGLSEVFDRAATSLHEQGSQEEPEPEPEEEPEEEKPKPRRRSRKT